MTNSTDLKRSRRLTMVDHVDRRPNRRFGVGRAFALALVLAPVLASSAHAASPVPLGTADSFALLAGSTITNTGPTSISGDIGLCCTGLDTPGLGPDNQSAGATYVGPNTLAQTAQRDLDIAYADAAGRPATIVPVNLSSSGTSQSPLLPGVYQSTSRGTLQINNGLTLDFLGDPNAVFIFQGTDLITAAGTAGSVNIVNGGATPSTCNIYWQLSTDATGVTLGAGSAFKGTTMALGASVLGTGATVQGRILTRDSKAVNLDTNTITRSACAAPAVGGGVGTGSPTGTPTLTRIPTPTSIPALTGIPTPTSIAAPTSGALPGTAKLSGPSSPVKGPFSVSVTGHAIKKVVFYVDGKRAGTVYAKPGRRKFKLTIKPAGQSPGVHRVTAKVTFTTASGTPRATRRLTYRRAFPAPRPQFTG